MPAPVTRRALLVTSAGTVAALAVGPTVAPAEEPAVPCGPVYGRTGRRGLPAAMAGVPSRGRVVLLDGSVVVVAHETGRAIGPGKSVWLGPDGRGGWSVLYAEV